MQLYTPEDDGRQKQIFVGNLHNEVGEDDLLRLFDKAGKVVDSVGDWTVELESSRIFVTLNIYMLSPADNALKFNEKTVLGRLVRVSLARGSNSSKKERRAQIVNGVKRRKYRFC